MISFYEVFFDIIKFTIAGLLVICFGASLGLRHNRHRKKLAKGKRYPEILNENNSYSLIILIGPVFNFIVIYYSYIYGSFDLFRQQFNRYMSSKKIFFPYQHKDFKFILNCCRGIIAFLSEDIENGINIYNSIEPPKKKRGSRFSEYDVKYIYLILQGITLYYQKDTDKSQSLLENNLNHVVSDTNKFICCYYLKKILIDKNNQGLASKYHDYAKNYAEKTLYTRYLAKGDTNDI
jgi:hypothetical protein